MTKQYLDYTEIDEAICQYLATSDGHPTNSDQLREMAAKITGVKPWRLIDRRMQAMRKSGRLKYMGRGLSNASGKKHGWLVAVPTS